MKSSPTLLAAAPFLLLLFSAISVSGIPDLGDFFPKNLSSSPWNSFQNLTGCHVGEHVPGLADLKRYLKRFGYMNFPDTNGTGVTDDFDDSLASAIKTYQHNFNLDPTGTLDISTVSQIVRPRCGVPDIINGSTAMNSSGAADPSKGRRLYTFFPGSPRWPSSRRDLTYAISPENRITAVDDAGLRSIFARAFERWANVTQLTFSESATYSSADIKIAFYSGDHGDGEPFDGVLGTLAHAFSPPNGHFHLDSAENWVADGVSSLSSVAEIDLESVAVHEIGHLLGLGHSSVEDAIMYPTIASGTKRVALAADDVDGVQALYGANPNYNGTSTSSNSSEEDTERSSSGGGRVAVGLGFLGGVILAVIDFLLL